MNLAKSTYPKFMIFFHILGILCVILAFTLIYTQDLFGRWSSFRYIWMQGHFLAGLLVLVLVLPRFINRIREYKKIPPIVPSLTSINQLLAHVGHITLYIWMIVMPLLGWALASALYGSISIFGIQIPGIVAQSQDTAKLLRELHEACGGIWLLLVIGHWGMALLHHFKMWDNTLVRMFPWFAQRTK